METIINIYYLTSKKINILKIVLIKNLLKKVSFGNLIEIITTLTDKS